jgi:hypothetical protein
MLDDTIIELQVLDSLDNPVTLYFSKFGFIDNAASPGPILYKRAILNSLLLSLAPDDGGVLSVFNTASVGDISIANIDGEFDFLKDYAFDGRSVIVSSVIKGTIYPVFFGTAGVPEFTLDTIVIPLRAIEETLTDNIELTKYLGDNILPTGLEGTVDDIKGNNKPELYGDCRNITPKLVNQSLNIYEVSTLSNCRIKAVYDTGAVLANYKTSAAASLGVGTVSVYKGLGDLPVGAEFYFDNHNTLYTITTGLSGGTISFTPALTQNVAKNVPVAVTNFYADETTANLQYVNYITDGNIAKGSATIPVTAGIGAISAGANIIFGNHLKIYEVLTALTAGVIVLTVGLKEDVLDATSVQVIGVKNPILWGAYHGYFRLSSPPAGEITVDAVSIDGSKNVHKAGDVLNLIGAKIGVTVDSTFATDLNSCGYIGLYLSDTIPKIDVLRTIVKSTASYFYFIANVLYGKLITTPSVSEDFTITDPMVLDSALRLVASGLGSNRVPVYALNVNFDKVETVQTAFAGIASVQWMERIKNQYRKLTLTNPSTLIRHLLSLTLDVDTIARVRSEVTANFTRLFNLIKVERDVIEVSVSSDDVLTYELGQTVKLISDRFGLLAGKNFILIGVDIDDNSNQKTFRLLG